MIVRAQLDGVVTEHIVNQSITVLEHHVVVAIEMLNAHSLVQLR